MLCKFRQLTSRLYANIAQSEIRKLWRHAKLYLHIFFSHSCVHKKKKSPQLYTRYSYIVSVFLIVLIYKTVNWQSSDKGFPPDPPPSFLPPSLRVISSLENRCAMRSRFNRRPFDLPRRESVKDRRSGTVKRHVRRYSVIDIYTPSRDERARPPDWHP